MLVHSELILDLWHAPLISSTGTLESHISQALVSSSSCRHIFKNLFCYSFVYGGGVHEGSSCGGRVWSPGAGLADSCEPRDVNVRNQTWGLSKSRKHSLLTMKPPFSSPLTLAFPLKMKEIENETPFSSKIQLLKLPGMKWIRLCISKIANFYQIFLWVQAQWNANS